MGTQKLRVQQNQQGFVRGFHILHFGSARLAQAYGRKSSSEEKQSFHYNVRGRGATRTWTRERK